jgi:hypothetical protein
MTINRWLLIAGLVMLIGMLVTCAFAVGVFIGERGWTGGGLQGLRQDMGQNAPPGNAPAGGQQPPRLPPGEPQLIGFIRYTTEETLELATEGGPRQVFVTERTDYWTKEGDVLQIQDLVTGDLVAVFGQYVGGDGTQLQADMVVRIPRPPKDDQ